MAIQTKEEASQNDQTIKQLNFDDIYSNKLSDYLNGRPEVQYLFV